LTGARVWWLGLALGLALGCSRPAEERRPPPLDTSAQAEWTYAAYLLGLGDANAALGYLEPLASGRFENVTNPPLLLRDLAEARLAAGDLPGASMAARQAREQLARRGRSAQFQADDRRVFERVVDGLEAAGDNDLQGLADLAADDSPSPSADVWYLLGWLQERHGNLLAARTAYSGFAQRAPQWLFLRQAALMRQHALAVLSA
jgi:hypothetical protein